MTALLRRTRLPRPILFLASVAIGAAIGATGTWLFIPFLDAAPDLAPHPPASLSEEAERLALTVLAVSVAALAILSGLVALALEGSVTPPVVATPAPRPATIVWREAVRRPEAPRRALAETPGRMLEHLDAA
jgi:hypothetical protein